MSAWPYSVITVAINIITDIFIKYCSEESRHACTQQIMMWAEIRVIGNVSWP